MDVDHPFGVQDNLAESVPLFEFAKCLLHLGKWEGYRDGYFNGPATWEADEFAEHDSRRAGCALSVLMPSCYVFA